ncbi:MAG: YebC/PmpR family DNA-binding transcriptional regulator [Pelagibacteraceae bacterium]|nr:YebC/PmpR family DNA-binding transcriptional regulator [Pelagibacteraceae bacterium]
MAGHSHWAGIKHKKGRADKRKSKIFSKISKEITVAAKLGDKDPNMNFRLRSAIQLARSANMPKENVERAISKSEANQNINYSCIRYEGMGPGNIYIIVETLTDNKNRTASNIRTIFQKCGGNLSTTGVASHNFKQLGIIRIEKKTISDEAILELAVEAGAEECISNENFHEIFCAKEQFYKVKTAIEKKVDIFIHSGIEWYPLNHLNLKENQYKSAVNLLESLEEDEDVQNVYTNLKEKKLN